MKFTKKNIYIYIYIFRFWLGHRPLLVVGSFKRKKNKNKKKKGEKERRRSAKKGERHWRPCGDSVAHLRPAVSRKFLEHSTQHKEHSYSVGFWFQRSNFPICGRMF